MELEVIKNQQNDLEFILKGERHTFPNLLRSRLLKDNSVTFAAYRLGHPLDENSVFIVKTKGKAAKKALQDACSGIGSELDQLRKSIKKALK